MSEADVFNIIEITIRKRRLCESKIDCVHLLSLTKPFYCCTKVESDKRCYVNNFHLSQMTSISFNWIKLVLLVVVCDLDEIK